MYKEGGKSDFANRKEKFRGATQSEEIYWTWLGLIVCVLFEPLSIGVGLGVVI